MEILWNTTIWVPFRDSVTADPERFGREMTQVKWPIVNIHWKKDVRFANWGSFAEEKRYPVRQGAVCTGKSSSFNGLKVMKEQRLIETSCSRPDAQTAAWSEPKPPSCPQCENSMKFWLQVSGKDVGNHWKPSSPCCLSPSVAETGNSQLTWATWSAGTWRHEKSTVPLQVWRLRGTWLRTLCLLKPRPCCFVFQQGSKSYFNGLMFTLLRRVHFHRQADSLILGDTFLAYAALDYKDEHILPCCSRLGAAVCHETSKSTCHNVCFISRLDDGSSIGAKFPRGSKGTSGHRRPVIALPFEEFLKQGGKRRQKITRITADWGEADPSLWDRDRMGSG